jgi:BNR repeat protein
MMKPIYSVLCLLVIIPVFSACSTGSVNEPPKALTVTEVTVPPGESTEGANLSTAPDGRVFLSWIQPGPTDGYQLMFSVRDTKGSWAEPKMIASGDNWFITDADFPSMTVLSDGTLAAHWPANAAEDVEAYDVNIALSHDDGATWSKPIVPHRDKVKSQHGFVSMLPSADGQLHVIWLDGRNAPEEGKGDMALMHTTVKADGSLGPEEVIDKRVCECCQTSAAATPDGLLVVYRDRSDEEIRDISLVRYSNGSWSQPAVINPDNWQIDACPVNGPAISSNGQNVAVAWFTGAEEKLGVYAVLSTDSGKTFGKPIQVDEGQPSGRVDVLSLPTGGALVSWMERGEPGSQIRVRRIDANGTAQPSAVVSGTSAVRPGSFARMELSGNQAFIAFISAGISQVKVASLDLAK